jgi:hypothetical protein
VGEKRELRVQQTSFSQLHTVASNLRVGIMTAAAPLGYDTAIAAQEEEKLPAGTIFVSATPAAEVANTNASTCAHVFTTESHDDAKEVTIRQVAPLLMVLTGATFLNASTMPLGKGPRLSIF